jgi:hypothetical protein
MHGKMREAYKCLIKKSKGKGKCHLATRPRGEDKIRAVLKDIGYENVNCIHMAMDRD